MKTFSLAARVRSFRFATLGLLQFFRTEHNTWIHLVLTVAAVAAGVYFNLSAMEWVAIIAMIALVWIAEILNTAIERAMDIVSPQFDSRVGFVKDLAAAAVLVAAIAAATTAAIIFIPKIS